VQSALLSFQQISEIVSEFFGIPPFFIRKPLMPQSELLVGTRFELALQNFAVHPLLHD
jgi:hypothetical protein